MHGDPVTNRNLVPQIKLGLEIWSITKSGFAVVAALNNMVAVVRQVHPCTAWHLGSLKVLKIRHGL